MAKPQRIEPRCIECGGLGVLTEGRAVYPHRSDLWGKQFYLCACGARVGVHQGTTIPLGYPCGPITAAARRSAHREFDLLWLTKAATVGRRQARREAYAWLAAQLGVPLDSCHISQMPAAQANLVASVCKPHADAIRRRKAAA